MMRARGYGIVPADIVCGFSRGSDPVDATRRADYWTGEVAGRAWRAMIRSGDEWSFNGWGYTWNLEEIGRVNGDRYSGHASSRAGCEWEVFDTLADIEHTTP